MKPKFIRTDDVVAWWNRHGPGDASSAGLARLDAESLRRLGVPPHLQLLCEHLDTSEARLDEQLASLSFHSLCRGLLLPLSSLDASRMASWFGVSCRPVAEPAARERLVAEFLGKPIGLTLPEKLGCLNCDPFQGRASTFRQDRLLHLLRTFALTGRRQLLERLAELGDLAALFAEARPEVRGAPPLTAAEVLRTLRLLPGQPLNRTLEILRSLLTRCGKLEAYYLSRLLLGRNGPGLGLPLVALARSLARQFEVPIEEVLRVESLTDIYQLGEVLESSGSEGLRAIRLRPLRAVRPSLASGTVAKLRRYPVWVERKYDGVRLLLHKETDERGRVSCAAFTRNRHDWMSLVPGLEETIRGLPAHSLILDGELCAQRLDGGGPADVYEIMEALRGGGPPLSWRFASFDVLYLNGRDVTPRPLRERQLVVSNLVAALAGRSAPVAVSLAEGQLARSESDLNRLYHHFRSQGYEGIIAKELSSPYRIAARDPAWLKRKPERTLDLVIVGATFAVGERHAGAFGSYVLAAREAGEGFVELGDVDGVGQWLDGEIQRRIVRDGLMTGRHIERRLAEGTRAGVELRPALVVTVMFQELTRESDGRWTLRHPRIKLLRADKSPDECDVL